MPFIPTLKYSRMSQLIHQLSFFLIKKQVFGFPNYWSDHCLAHVITHIVLVTPASLSKRREGTCNLRSITQLYDWWTQIAILHPVFSIHHKILDIWGRNVSIPVAFWSRFVPNLESTINSGFMGSDSGIKCYLDK